MSVFANKLKRTIWTTRGQFLAVVAVVVVGIAVYISMSTSYYNLTRSRDQLYQDTNFAGYYFHLVRAPEEITRQIESIPGISKATGRIQMDVPIIKEEGDRATARLTSYPLPMDTEVNQLQLVTGRLFDKNAEGGGIEALVDPPYAKANNLTLNSQITVVAEGKRVPLTIVGTATGAEFIYPMQDAASLMPEPESFGIVMVPQNQAQQLLNLPGQINQVVVTFAPGADEAETARLVETVLEPYGVLASYSREQQLSHAVLQMELDGLKTQSYFMPVLFLGIAAVIQFILLGRIVKSQRLQIGIMKALGYSNGQIIWYYVSYALAAALTAAVLGTVLGLLLASVFSQAYALYFNLPGTIGGVNGKAIVSGVALSLGVGALSGLAAARRVTQINPVESMRPEPPKSARSLLLERWVWLWRKLGTPWKMVLRTVGRNWLRFGFTVLGVVFAVGLLVVALFFNDAMDFLVKTHFFQEQRYDYLLRFTGPVKDHELLNLGRIDGVVEVEPLFELPVKIRYGGRAEEDVLLGLPDDVSLKALVSDDGRPLRVPEAGVLLNQHTANKLGVTAGDQVEVETRLGLGPARHGSLEVIGINRQLVGGGSYLNLLQANRLLQETGLVTGAMLKVDPGKADDIERELRDLTGIASITSRQAEMNSFTRNMEAMFFAIAIIVMFAVILGFAIVYNSSLVGFAERRRELASLRVIGFTRREVSGLLFRETALQAFCGVVFGLPFGRLLAELVAYAFNTDLFSFVVVIYPRTYLLSAVGGVAFILIAQLFVVKGIKQLDLVEVLKNRD